MARLDVPRPEREGSAARRQETLLLQCSICCRHPATRAQGSYPDLSETLKGNGPQTDPLVGNGCRPGRATFLEWKVLRSQSSKGSVCGDNTCCTLPYRTTPTCPLPRPTALCNPLRMPRVGALCAAAGHSPATPCNPSGSTNYVLLFSGHALHGRFGSYSQTEVPCMPDNQNVTRTRSANQPSERTQQRFKEPTCPHHHLGALKHHHPVPSRPVPSRPVPSRPPLVQILKRASERLWM